MTNIYQHQKNCFEVEASWGAASVRHSAGFPSSYRKKTHPMRSFCYEVPLGPSIVVWDIQKRNRKTFFQAHNDLITVMLYNSQYDIVITASYSGEVKLWDNEWNVLFCIDTSVSKLQDGKWSVDGSHLAFTSIGDDSTLIIYTLKYQQSCEGISASLSFKWKTQASFYCELSAETKSAPESSTFTHYNDAFDGVLFNPNGKLLAFLCKKDSSSYLFLFSADGLREKQVVLEPLGEKASSIMCVSECKFDVFAVGFQGGIFMLLDCNKLDSLGVFQATGSPQAVIWDNENLLAFSYLSGIISWWNTQGELLYELCGGPTDSVIHLNWDVEGKSLWVGGIMSLHYVDLKYENHSSSYSDSQSGKGVGEGDSMKVREGNCINQGEREGLQIRESKHSVMGQSCTHSGIRDSSLDAGTMVDNTSDCEFVNEGQNMELPKHPAVLNIRHSIKFHEVTGCGIDLTSSDLIVSGDFTGNVNVWDRGKVFPSHSLNVHSSVRCISCQDNEIFIGTLEGCILKWDFTKKDKCPEECLYPPGGVLNMRWSQNRMYLVLGLTTGYLEVFEYSTTKEFVCKLSVLGHRNVIEGTDVPMEVWSVCWSPCEQMIATASEDHTACIWNLQGSKLHTLRGHSTAVTSVDWQLMSLGTKTLATCADDRTVRIYDGENFSLLNILDSKDIHGWHTLTYLCLNVRDNQCLCSTQNGHLILWDVVSGERLACFKIHCGSIEGLVWKNDLIGTVSSDCVVNMFTVKKC